MENSHSGMSIQRNACNCWCMANDICEQTYYKNLKALREKLCNNRPVPLSDMEKPVAFKKFEIESPLPNTQATVVIQLPKATLENC